MNHVQASVDVLLPYYGDEQLMKEAVQSVISQESRDWRLLIVDDATPHVHPAGWVASLGDSRIHYERNSENLGANRNFQKALEMSNAPVVVFMGADDMMLPGYLGSVLDLFESYPQASVVQPGVRVVGSEGEPSKTLVDSIKGFLAPRSREPVILTGERMAASLLHAGWHYFPSLAWRRSAIASLGFRPEYDVVQDLALLLDVAASGGSILVSRDPVVFCYRRHAASDSSVRAADGRRFDEEKKFFRDQTHALARKGWPKAARAARIHWTSRLHALVLLIRSLPTIKGSSAKTLGRHILLSLLIN